MVMLYVNVEVNGIALKAFVDGGADVIIFVGCEAVRIGTAH